MVPGFYTINSFFQRQASLLVKFITFLINLELRHTLHRNFSSKPSDKKKKKGIRRNKQIQVVELPD